MADEQQWRMPSHCLFCGAYLKGGATVHAPNCEIKKLIERNFPQSVTITPAPEDDR